MFFPNHGSQDKFLSPWESWLKDSWMLFNNTRHISTNILPVSINLTTLLSIVFKLTRQALLPCHQAARFLTHTLLWLKSWKVNHYTLLYLSRISHPRIVFNAGTGYITWWFHLMLCCTRMLMATALVAWTSFGEWKVKLIRVRTVKYWSNCLQICQYLFPEM